MINIKKTIHLKGTYEDGHFSFTEDTNNNHQAVIEADLINNKIIEAWKDLSTKKL
jgi:hypothetical protein